MQLSKFLIYFNIVDYILEKSNIAWRICSKNYFAIINVLKIYLYRKVFSLLSGVFLLEFLLSLSLWWLHREFYEELWCAGHSYLVVKVITSIAEAKLQLHRGGPLIILSSFLLLMKSFYKYLVIFAFSSESPWFSLMKTWNVLLDMRLYGQYRNWNNLIQFTDSKSNTIHTWRKRQTIVVGGKAKCSIFFYTDGLKAALLLL